MLIDCHPEAAAERMVNHTPEISSKFRLLLNSDFLREPKLH